jgi:hypothetical protein
MSTLDKDNLAWLTGVPSTDGGFKSALEDATMEELGEALAERGKRQSKTAFRAIRAEIRRRCEETGLPFSEPPTFESFSPAVLDKQRKDRDWETLYHRDLVRHGSLTANLAIAARRLSTEPEISNGGGSSLNSYQASRKQPGTPTPSNADGGCRSTKSEPKKATSAVRASLLKNPPMKIELQYLPPSALSLHPVLDGFPELAAAQYEALKASVDELGVLEPLMAVKDGEGKLLVFDGRHRRRAALDLLKETVPVIVRSDIDPLDYAIERAAVGRQLTKSGVVLMLFEKHPSLADGATDRKGGRTAHSMRSSYEKGENPRAHSGRTGEEGTVSYRALAERYQVPEQYFRLLAKIKFGAPADGEHSLVKPATEEQWLWVRRAILEEEMAITAVIRGYQSQNATLGKHRADPVYLTYNPATGKLGGILPASLISLKNGFSQWPKLDFQARGELKKQWDELQTAIPEDLK